MRPEQSLGRCLIVNADDFGLSEDVNSGVARAHEKGILSSASLMVDAPAAAAAADYSRSHPRLSVGLHLDLGAWMWRDGDWIECYRTVDMNDAVAVATEVERQLKAFQSLTGGRPTHLDSHQHVHLEEPVRSIVLERARCLSVPVRSFTPNLNYCGRYYGQTKEGHPLHEAISVEALIAILISLPVGITELGCHPAQGLNVGDPVYCIEREKELLALCDDRVSQTLNSEGIQILSFCNIGYVWSNG